MTEEEKRRRDREYAKRRRAEHPELVRDQYRKWRTANPEKALEATNKWCKNNLDKINAARRQRRAGREDAINEQLRDWHSNNPGKAKMYNRRNRTKLFKQFGVPTECEVCRRVFDTDSQANWDHDHELEIAGKSKDVQFRGWLCFNCNTAMGQLKDDPDTINRLYEYASRHLLRRNDLL